MEVLAEKERALLSKREKDRLRRIRRKEEEEFQKNFLPLVGKNFQSHYENASKKEKQRLRLLVSFAFLGPEETKFTAPNYHLPLTAQNELVSFCSDIAYAEHPLLFNTRLRRYHENGAPQSAMLSVKRALLKFPNQEIYIRNKGKLESILAAQKPHTHE